MKPNQKTTVFPETDKLQMVQDIRENYWYGIKVKVNCFGYNLIYFVKTQFIWSFKIFMRKYIYNTLNITIRMRHIKQNHWHCLMLEIKRLWIFFTWLNIWNNVSERIRTLRQCNAICWTKDVRATLAQCHYM